MGARLCQAREALAGAHEEVDAELLFQLTDLATDTGLRSEERLGDLGQIEVATLGLADRAQLLEVHGRRILGRRRALVVESMAISICAICWVAGSVAERPLLNTCVIKPLLSRRPRPPAAVPFHPALGQREGAEAGLGIDAPAAGRQRRGCGGGRPSPRPAQCRGGVHPGSLVLAISWVVMGRRPWGSSSAKPKRSGSASATSRACCTALPPWSAGSAPAPARIKLWATASQGPSPADWTVLWMRSAQRARSKAMLKSRCTTRRRRGAGAAASFASAQGRCH